MLFYFSSAISRVKADVGVNLVWTGEYKKDELLEAARSGNEEQMMALLTPLNVNCHASDGRKVCILYMNFFTRLQYVYACMFFTSIFGGVFYTQGFAGVDRVFC